MLVRNAKKMGFTEFGRYKKTLILKDLSSKPGVVASLVVTKSIKSMETKFLCLIALSVRRTFASQEQPQIMALFD